MSITRKRHSSIVSSCRFGVASVAALSVCMLASALQADQIGPGTFEEFSRITGSTPVGETRNIELTQSNPTFSPNLSPGPSGNEADNFLGELAALLGSGTGSDSNPDIAYAFGGDNFAGVGSPSVGLGESNGRQSATIAYKFEAPSGQVFDGGTVTAEVGFRGGFGQEEAAVLGTSTDFAPRAPSLSDWDGTFSDQQTVQAAPFHTEGFDTESGTMTVSIPSGVSTFSVILQNRNSGSFSFDDLNVNANVVPEPGSAVLSLAGLAGLAMFGRRRRS